MGIFNDLILGALFGGDYICSQCGGIMNYDEDEEILICPDCGHEIDYERYGCEDDETYEKLYPTEAEVLGLYDEDEYDEDDEDNEDGEYYDPEFDE